MLREESLLSRCLPGRRCSQHLGLVLSGGCGRRKRKNLEESLPLSFLLPATARAHTRTLKHSHTPQTKNEGFSESVFCLCLVFISGSWVAFASWLGNQEERKKTTRKRRQTACDLRSDFPPAAPAAGSGGAGIPQGSWLHREGAVACAALTVLTRTP